MKEIDKSGIKVCFLLAFAIIFSLTCAFAYEFDNVKDYTPEPQPYGTVEIVNAFGLGEVLEKATLLDNTETCDRFCEANKEITLYSSGALIDKLDFYRVYEDGSRQLSNIRWYKLEYYGSIDDYETQCKDGEPIYSEVNETYSTPKICEQVKIGSNEGWIEFKEGQIFNAGTYQVRLTGEKRSGWQYDWVPTLSGKQVTEWATWGNISLGAQAQVTLNSPANNTTIYLNPVTHNISANVTGGAGIINLSYWNDVGGWSMKNYTEGSIGATGLVSYYKLDNNSFIDSINLHNATNVGTTNTSGKIGDGRLFNGISNTINATGNYISGNPNFSYSFWIKNGGPAETEVLFAPVPLTANDPSTAFFPTIQTNGKIRIVLYNNEYLETTNSIVNDTWTFITITKSSGTVASTTKIYINGAEETLTKQGGTATPNYANGNLTFGVGISAFGGEYYDGSMDEIGVWNKTLNSTEVSSLYNSGIGRRLYQNYINSLFIYSFPNDGLIHKWAGMGCDTDNVCGFSVYNYTIMVDNVSPKVALPYPTSLIDYGAVNQTMNLSIVATDTNLDKVWYNYNGTNVTIVGAVSGIANLSNITLSSKKNVTIYANDTAGNINATTFSWDYNLFENSRSYSATTIATSLETFTINVTFNSSNYYDIVGTLYYNGSNYTSTKTTSTNNAILSNTILVPNALISTNYTFYWTLTLTNLTGSYNINSTSSTQIVNPMQAINVTSLTCPSGFSPAFNFSFFNETNLGSINATTVYYNFQYGTGINNALVANGTLSNIHLFSICINSSSNYSLGYGEVDYSIDGYSSRKFYIFNNTRMVNTTISNNLYALETSISTPFQITATTTTLQPYSDNYIGLLRWYPNLNQYNVVEMGKTDNNGQTVLNVKTNDVDYRLALYSSSGTLIKFLNPIRMVCQTNPCVYSIITSGEEIDLTAYLNVQNSLTYDKTTKKYTFVWNDPSQNTKTMNLLVFRDYPDKNSTVVCNTSASGFTGILVCDVTGQNGNLRAEAWRTASPPNIIARLTNSLQSTFKELSGGSDLGLFFGFVLVVTFSTIGLVSPIAVVILSIISIMPMLLLGNITLAVFMILGAIGGVILYMLRRSTGQ